jgi:hypothetical protein
MHLIDELSGIGELRRADGTPVRSDAVTSSESFRG